MKFRLTIIACALLATGSAMATTCTNPTVAVQSGTTSVAVAELYTSEGCDSCPPADKWFSTLSHRNGGAIPLAFHVDYWDSLGWKDRFAKPAYTLRQRIAAFHAGGKAVVTPQLVVSGKTINFGSNEDRRGSITSRFYSRVREVAALPPKASLKLTAIATMATMATETGTIDASLSVTLAGTGTSPDAAAWLAITENNLRSYIKAGENAGVTVDHDHVVRELIGPLKIPRSTDGNAPIAQNIAQSIALPKDWKRQDLSLVAFVQDQRTGEVYQALASPICSEG